MPALDFKHLHSARHLDKGVVSAAPFGIVSQTLADELSTAAAELFTVVNMAAY